MPILPWALRYKDMGAQLQIGMITLGFYVVCYCSLVSYCIVDCHVLYISMTSNKYLI